MIYFARFFPKSLQFFRKSCRKSANFSQAVFHRPESFFLLSLLRHLKRLSFLFPLFLTSTLHHNFLVVLHNKKTSCYTCLFSVPYLLDIHCRKNNFKFFTNIYFYIICHRIFFHGISFRFKIIYHDSVLIRIYNPIFPYTSRTIFE